jgi:xanthine dehydrogenase iron-sulfur cluster and FAD-binding subunit A
VNRNHEGSGIFGAKGASCTAAALNLFTNAQLYCTYGYFLSSLSVVSGAFQASAAAIIAALKSALCNAARYQPDSAAKYNKDALQNDVIVLLNENNVAENTLSRANAMPRSVHMARPRHAHTRALIRDVFCALLLCDNSTGERCE